MAVTLLVPVTATLAFGFTEEMAWTRPLLVVLLGCGAAVAGACGLRVESVLLVLVSLGTASYLYGSRAVRRYYSYLRENASVRVSAADLRSAVFVPLYTGAVGFVVGAFLGWYLVSLDPEYRSARFHFHDFYGLALASFACGSALAILGRLLGEAIISRLSRAA